jgi:hypothetical protein
MQGKKLIVSFAQTPKTHQPAAAQRAISTTSLFSSTLFLNAKDMSKIKVFTSLSDTHFIITTPLHSRAYFTVISLIIKSMKLTLQVKKSMFRVNNIFLKRGRIGTQVIFHCFFFNENTKAAAS